MNATAVLERVRVQATAAMVAPYRACELCDHHAGGQCLQDPHLVLPLHTARSHAGPCGPEAERMQVAAWDHDERRTSHC